MIKVFQIITSVNLGGAENVVFNLIERCLTTYPNKFEFIVLEVHSTNSRYAIQKKSHLTSIGVEVITLGSYNKRLSIFSASFNLLKHVIRKNPNVIHSHTDIPDFVTGFVLKILKVKNTEIVRTIHNTQLWADHQKIGKFVESSFNGDSVVCVSEGAYNAFLDLRRKFKFDVNSNLKIIFNGCKMPSKAEHKFEIASQKINIAFCGRFVYQKGIDIIVDYINRINSTFQDKFVFHFIGSGPYNQIVKDLALISSNVLYYEPVDEIANKLYDFDYLLLPSRFEGLPLISIESSLAKVPVIAARAPGLLETLPLDWPLYFDLDSFDSFLKVMEVILNENNVNSLKEYAYDFALNKFSIDQMVASYVRVYTQ